MSGLLNIQLIHNLRSAHVCGIKILIELFSNYFIWTEQQIAKGIVDGTDAGIILSAEQCTQIGIHARVSGLYYQSMDWLSTAMEKVLIEGDMAGNLEDIREEFEFAEMAVSTSAA